MEERENAVGPVDYIVFETTLARMDKTHNEEMERKERTEKRFLAIIVLLAVLLVASWVGFFAYEIQFETVEETTTEEHYEANADGGGAAIVNRDGEVTYGDG